jgi:aryl-alcohol dehydrogenase-like predicted oxidoreductase/chlorite dismutase
MTSLHAGPSAGDRTPGHLGGPTHTAIGTWSGGNFLPFGVGLDHDRLVRLLRPGPDLRTVLTADVYGCGDADRVLGHAIEGVPRSSYCLVGAIGHDFYSGRREGRGGFQRFTDAGLRAPAQYADYLRMATEQSLERCGVDAFDLLLLHNPDRTGYESEAVWTGMDALRQTGLTRLIGIAPGPDNGFILDLIGCFERFGELIDWAMLILNPFEPWPASLALPAAAAHEVKVMTRVLDHGGVFWDDVRPGHRFPPGDHRTFRPPGWVESANARLDRIRPIAERHGLTPLQLAGAWNLAHEAVACVIPTLSQELGDPARPARPVEDKRAELAGVPTTPVLTPDEIAEIRAVGDNRGSVPLKGASRQYSGVPRADQWPITAPLEDIATRWGIEPDRDLYVPDDLRDLRERGAPTSGGAVQACDRRLFVHLQAFTGIATGGPEELLSMLAGGAAEGVVYESVTDPLGAAIVVVSEDADALTTTVRRLAADGLSLGYAPVGELAMFGRTYGSGREPQLEDWLVHAPRRKLAAPEAGWAVWYPLRRTGAYYRLPARDQGRILGEHGKIGAIFGQAGYGNDVRLECFGLDRDDNEFVIGVLGPRLDGLSRLVKAMRGTEQTATYIERLGPFFIGRRVGHTIS